MLRNIIIKIHTDIVSIFLFLSYLSIFYKDKCGISKNIKKTSTKIKL